jgi:2-alkyl-3-oxoalkanoate reductase
MNAAVTGGTGFLGQALLRLLVPAAESVRVLVRRTEDMERVRSLGADPVRGDLTAASGCNGLVREGDTVFHAAARVDLRGRWSAFRETTIEGTRRLLDAALARKPARFVYVSSGGVYLGGKSAGGRPVACPARHDLYSRAKLAAEGVVQRACDRAGCPWAILRLGVLYGPGGRSWVEYFQLLRRQGWFRLIGDAHNRIATLYIDDAARAVILCGIHPAASAQIYDVASEEGVTQDQFVNGLAAAFGLPPVRRRVSRRIAIAAAFAAECAARLFGREPPFNRTMIGIIAVDQMLDTTPLRDLGWRPEVTFAEGVRRTAEWYRREWPGTAAPAPESASSRSNTEARS